MIIEYDDESRCILINDEPVLISEAMGLLKELDQAINEWEHDHDEPDGHCDD